MPCRTSGLDKSRQGDSWMLSAVVWPGVRGSMTFSSYQSLVESSLLALSIVLRDADQFANKTNSCSVGYHLQFSVVGIFFAIVVEG